jgi:uncharacterized protein
LFTDEEPSPDLAAHFRYPEDLFELQTEVYLSYHILDSQDFYSREDEWSIPQTSSTTTEQTALQFGEATQPLPATYLLTHLPGEESDEFLLTRPVTPRSKNNMVAFIVARSDPAHYGEVITLQFPRSRTVLGPAQVASVINQDVEISQTLTLLRQEGSDVSFGSLVTLPITDSILYVQPLFLTAEDIGIPELKRVIIVFGQDVVMENTFEEALASLFGLEPAGEGPEPEPQPTGGGKPPKGGEQPTPQVSELERLIASAGDLYDRAQDALTRGDFATYGDLIEELGTVLDRIETLSNTGA